MNNIEFFLDQVSNKQKCIFNFNILLLKTLNNFSLTGNYLLDLLYKTNSVHCSFQVNYYLLMALYMQLFPG